eukprot:1159724-Pelagomonas_calceolata.AAC.8
MLSYPHSCNLPLPNSASSSRAPHIECASPSRASSAQHVIAFISSRLQCPITHLCQQRSRAPHIKRTSLSRSPGAQHRHACTVEGGGQRRKQRGVRRG